MPTVNPPSISGLPAAPDPNDRSTFNTRAYPWSAALPTLSTEISAVAANVKANADDAKVNADIAVAQVPLATAQVALATAQAGLSQQAAVSAGAIAWVSGTAYAIGDLRYSPIDFQTYRRKTAGAGTTDPSADSVGWAAASTWQGIFIEVLTSGTSWVCPIGVTKVKVTGVGGGGGGGRSGNTSKAQPGGAGGAFIKSVSVAPGVAYSYLIGGGGADGASNGTDGIQGGTTSFIAGGITYSASGGSGGSSNSAEFSLSTGGTGTNGDINCEGGRGRVVVSSSIDGLPGQSIYGLGPGRGGFGVAMNTGGSTGSSGLLVLEY